MNQDHVSHKDLLKNRIRQSVLSNSFRRWKIDPSFELELKSSSYRDQQEVELSYEVFQSPLGKFLVCVLDDKIVSLMYAEDASLDELLEALRLKWPNAKLESNQQSSIVDEIINRMLDKPSHKLKLLIAGTKFQLDVWKALLKIPEGQVTSYGNVSKLINKPLANRAVGTAIGSNPIGYLVPCHRVVKGSGEIGNFFWGTEIKQMFLTREFLKHEKSH